MPLVKSLIKRHEVEVAKRKRTCKNSHQAIEAGEKCLVVYEGQYDTKTYCKEVALEMIKKAKKNLDDLEQNF